jgi:UPF0176 protein
LAFPNAVFLLAMGKKQLRNLVDRKVLLQQMAESDEPRTTISFYQYAHILNPAFFRDFLFENWSEMGVLGRTYVAREGINAQISVPTPEVAAFRDHLYSIRFLDGIRLNEAVDDGKSFFKLTIKVRPKIVADGLDDETFDVTDCGVHLDAASFNELTAKPDTILIDMRNHYESEVGHFMGAITPEVNTFREEIEVVENMLQGKEQENIVMYCTGGIRCEKASAYLKHKGFKNVHQLNGGIIEYTRQVREQGLENRYIGKNFVFDARLAERISDHVVSNCHQCGAPCDDHTNCANVGCNQLLIQCPSCAEQYEGTCSPACQQIIQLSEEEQRALRKGKRDSKRIFSKARRRGQLRQGMAAAAVSRGKSGSIGAAGN